ncbi:MAG: L,D-transpeptidase family protein [Caldilineaceae bacterium]
MSPMLRLDRESAAAALRNLTPELETAAVDASIEIIDGSAVITEPHRLRRGHRGDGRSALVAPLRCGSGWTSAAALCRCATPHHQRRSGRRGADVNGLLSSAINIDLYDPILDQQQWWTVSPAVWGAWLVVDLQPTDGSSYAWAVAPGAVRAYLSAQSAALGAGRSVRLDAAVESVRGAVENRSYATSLRLYHSERAHTVQPARRFQSIAFRYGMPYPWLEQANPGAVDNLWAGQTLVIPSPDELAPLPVVRNKRVVVSIGEQRMWAYENGDLKWEWPVSTGIDSSPTSPGVFQI